MIGDTLFRVRCWLIEKLAGRDTIICNAIIGKNGAFLTMGPERRRAFVDSRSRFYAGQIDTGLRIPHSPAPEEK